MLRRKREGRLQEGQREGGTEVRAQIEAEGQARLQTESAASGSVPQPEQGQVSNGTVDSSAVFQASFNRPEQRS